MITKKGASIQKSALVFITVSAFLFNTQLSAQQQALTEQEKLFEMSIEELMEIPVVVSASKTEESIVHSPSVVTVISKEQIRAQGLKTLNEVLARTVGFFPGNQQSWPPYGSRGIITDAPRQYLLLIDGHSQNSIIAFGAFFQHTYPLLEKVERIEIIRGPGSTLWGSDAVLGIINIITKDGGSEKEFEVTENVWGYDSIKGRDGINHYTNVLYNFVSGEDVKGMVSATYFDGDGYCTEQKTTATGAHALTAPQYDWNNNGEIYTKIKVNNLTLKARIVEGEDTDVGASTAEYYDEPNGWKHSISGLEQMWIEAEHVKEFDNGFNLATKLFSQKMEVLRWAIYGENQSYQQYVQREINKGIEAMLSGQIGIHNFKVGTRYTTTKVGPHFKAPTEYVNGNQWYLEDVNDGSFLVNDKMAVDTDTIYGLYAEDNIKLTKKLNLVAGGRADRNDLREKKTILLPRLALINNMTKNLTLKYMYNTGYRRPGVREAGKLNSTATGVKSEEIAQHDIQLMCNTDKIQASLTLFQLKLENPIAWEDDGYTNIGNTTSKGVEIDGRYKLNKKMTFYGNYSYSDATSEAADKLNIHSRNKHYTGIPRTMFNLGVTYDLMKKIMLNLHLRGWNNMYARWNDSYGKQSSAYYLDMNLTATNLFNLPLEASLYSTNLLNNNAEYGLYQGGTFRSEPRSIGMKAKYRF